jgi:hypothetical protein
MKPARTVTVLAVSALVALGLTACDKPNPGATVFSGTTSQWRTAACWSGTDQPIDASKCARDVVDNAVAGATIGTIPVVPGQVIGISVDPVVADAGWVATVNDQNITPAQVTSTYFRFTFPDLSKVPAEGIVMKIVAGKTGNLKGLWLFKIVPA